MTGLATRCPDCVGVDFQPAMVEYARQQRPKIDFRVGDMRTVRLGRTFQVVLSLGWAIANIHSNVDLGRVMDTFAAHSESGTLLVLEVINPNRIDCLPRRVTIDSPGFPQRPPSCSPTARAATGNDLPADLSSLDEAERRLVYAWAVWLAGADSVTAAAETELLTSLRLEPETADTLQSKVDDLRA